jgi:hypothetical protein
MATIHYREITIVRYVGVEKARFTEVGVVSSHCYFEGVYGGKI